MSAKAKDKYITLLVHVKFAAFDWGKVFIDAFADRAAKEKYTLCITYDAMRVTDLTGQSRCAIIKT